MNFFKKWYTYQKERFPLLIYGLYIFCIVFGVFCYNVAFADLTRNTQMENFLSLYLEPYNLNYFKIIPMFIVAFLQFLMIRIIDEFKDYEEDCKYRPYRPVPRGLVSLKELKVLFLICAGIQVGITWWCGRKESLFFLALLWINFFLMTKGFYIKKILDKHILLEVLLDEIMLPVLILYLSSFVYIVEIKVIWRLLVIGYIISWIVEMARKVRCKEDEEEGVRTYTAVFGIPKAVGILFVLETILAGLVFWVLGNKYLLPIAIVYVITNLTNILFIFEKSKKFAKATELFANIYIMLAYLSMGLLIF